MPRAAFLALCAPEGIVSHSPEFRASVEATYGHDSASVVGGRFGMTRNAVIGLWNRGIAAGRIVPIPADELRKRQHAKPQPAPKATSPKRKVRPVPLVPDPEPVCGVLSDLTGAAAAVYAARRGTCRWPSGHPHEPGFRFCGAVIADAYRPDGAVQPYCEACRSQAVQLRPSAFLRRRASEMPGAAA